MQNLVACADLKPLSHREIMNIAKCDVSRNKLFSQRKAGTEESNVTQVTYDQVSQMQPPKHSRDFALNWKRNCKSSSEKYE
jgi:hypothetical protein